MADVGSLSTLGLGSSGVLSYDVIDELRAADESLILDPIDANITAVEEKETVLAQIITYASGLKGAVLDLSTDTLFAKRTASVSGEQVEVSAVDGADILDASIIVNNLAQVYVGESQGFASRESEITAVGDVLTITVGADNYKLEIAAGTTLEALMQQINSETNGALEATILNTGGENSYSLVVKSAETGADQVVSYSYANGSDLLGMGTIQEGGDADFTYDGIDITRSSNTVDDLINGVTLTLVGEDSEVTNRISISQDVEGIEESIQAFVDAYNELFTAMDEVTKYDSETETAGIFQGDSTLNSFQSTINRLLFDSYGAEGEGVSTYGLTVTQDGYLEFDTELFEEGMSEDPDMLATVFSDMDTGAFTLLYDYLDNNISGSDALLESYSTYLSDSVENLTETRASKVEYLDSRYAIMATRFAAYDAIINSLTASFQTLQDIIDSETSSS